MCTANAVPFACVSAADPAVLNTAYSVGAAASEGGFTANDYSAERGTVTKHVEFKINTAEIFADELEAMGYTISEDRTVTSKDTTLAKITYTFNKLPTTLDELKNFSMKSDVKGDYDYGMFAPMAATIIALHTYGTNKEEALKMLEYAYGPQTFSNIDKQFVQTQFYTAMSAIYSRAKMSHGMNCSAKQRGHSRFRYWQESRISSLIIKQNTEKHEVFG